MLFWAFAGDEPLLELWNWAALSCLAAPGFYKDFVFGSQIPVRSQLQVQLLVFSFVEKQLSHQVLLLNHLAHSMPGSMFMVISLDIFVHPPSKKNSEFLVF